MVGCAGIPVVEIIFWLALVSLVYSYLLYPGLLAVVSPLLGKSARPTPPETLDLPEVAVIFAAHNEETHIGRRIENLLSQAYPTDKLRIYVGSDGSTDGTVEIARRFASERVRVFAFDERRGKASVLNDLVREVEEPITVFTDANVLFEPDAVAELVGKFSGTNVGVVCGELLLQERKGINPDTFYWRLERLLKRVEGRIGGLLGANGAIYAARTSVVSPLPADTVIDDFVIAMRVATLGKDLVYHEHAQAREEAPDRIGVEFRRRVRIGTGNYQAFFRYPEFLYRTTPVRVLTYVSHKVLRWFAPHLLATILISSMILSPRPAYALAFWAQVVFYVFASVLLLLERLFRLPPLFLIPAFLVSLNAAFAVAFWSYLTTETQGYWSRTDRSSSEESEP